MRILHIITSADPKSGGPIEGVRQLSAVLTEMGHKPEVASCDDPTADFIAKFPIPIHALGPGNGVYNYSPKIKPWLIENVDQYDAVIIEGIWCYHSLAGHAACQAKGKPYYIFTHGMLDPWFNRTYPLKKLKKMLFWPWQYPALRDAKSVLYTCEDEKLLARESFRPYKVTETVVPFGTGRPPTDEDGSQIRAFHESFPQMKGKRFLLFLSRIHPKKGCDLLIKAFNEVALSEPDLHLVMAGPGDQSYLDELHSIPVDPAVKDRILWTGMVSGEAKYGAFRACEAFILPSHQENFGIAVAEALACGKPVLIGKGINIWREIVEDKAGFMEPDTVEGTVNLMKRWLALSKAEQEAMGRQALACYEKRFTVENYARELIKVLES